jgi:hypothetical protein
VQGSVLHHIRKIGFESLIIHLRICAAVTRFTTHMRFVAQQNYVITIYELKYAIF